MDIAVLIKQVPDTWSERTLKESDWTLDRESVDAVIDEIDTRGVETALQLIEKHGGEVTVVTMGPDTATDALRKALAMGADKALHITDDGLAGSDALQTSAALAAAIRPLGVDLVITGNESTDGRTGSIPSMLAERLGLPQITSVRTLEIDGTTLRAERVRDGGYSEVTATLPAVVSVTEKINDPRYPSFKGIMAAKKKPVSTSGSPISGSIRPRPAWPTPPPSSSTGRRRPPRTGGQKITDDGTGGAKVAEFLAAARLI